jgi:hypothetical protein
MLPGKGGIEKYFSMNQRMVLFVENTELTYAEREAQNAEYNRREREEKEKAANKFRSMGYKKY